jgi:hypothetical protein
LEGRRSDGSGLSAWECLRRLRCRFGPSRPAMELSRCQRLGGGAAITGQRRVRIGLRHIRALKLGGTIWDIVVPASARVASRATQSPLCALSYLEMRDADTIRRGAPWTGGQCARRRPTGSGRAADMKAARKAQIRAMRHIPRGCRNGRLMTHRRKPKETSTLVTDGRLIERHIKPLIGSAKVSAFIHSDVEQFTHDVAAGTSRARRTGKKRALRVSAVAAGLQAPPSVCSGQSSPTRLAHHAAWGR